VTGPAGLAELAGAERAAPAAAGTVLVAVTAAAGGAARKVRAALESVDTNLTLHCLPAGNYTAIARIIALIA
jgi:hypothetical protein